MGVKHDILSVMRQWAPEDTAEPWDHVGLQLDTNRTIERVAILLEMNLDTYGVFSEYQYDFVIAHHPLIFKPLVRLGYDDWTHRVLRDLVKQDIGFYASHTNLDRAVDGVNDVLIRQYDFDIQDQSDLSNGYGKFIQLNQSLTLHDIEDKIPMVANIIPNDFSINTVAVCGGSGKAFVNAVVKKKPDLYITGELGYHDMQYLRQQNIGVILLGHYQSEAFILDTIKQRLDHLDIEIDIIK